MPHKLTRLERIMLANQHDILAALRAGEQKEYHEQAAFVLRQGFEGEYRRAALDEHEADSNVLTEDECMEVREIMDLFRVAQRRDPSFQFSGFRPGERQHSYVEYVVRTDDGFNFNQAQNVPPGMLAVYQRALATWKRQGCPADDLSDEQLAELRASLASGD